MCDERPTLQVDAAASSLEDGGDDVLPDLLSLSLASVRVYKDDQTTVRRYACKRRLFELLLEFGAEGRLTGVSSDLKGVRPAFDGVCNYIGDVK